MSWKLGPVMMSPALLLHTQDMDHWELELPTNLRVDYAKFYNHEEGLYLVDVKLGRGASHEGQAAIRHYAYQVGAFSMIVKTDGSCAALITGNH